MSNQHGHINQVGSQESLGYRGRSARCYRPAAGRVRCPSSHRRRRPPFLYRSRDTAINANCTGGTHEISNLGNRALGRYSVYANASFSSSTVGIWLYSRWQQIAATVADRQLWCYGTDYYWQYYAANAYHREVSQEYICSGGCQWIGNYYTAWEPGS